MQFTFVVCIFLLAGFQALAQTVLTETLANIPNSCSGGTLFIAKDQPAQQQLYVCVNGTFSAENSGIPVTPPPPPPPPPPTGIAADDFTGSTLNTFWTPTGSAVVANGLLTLAVPGGSNHDPFVGGNVINVMQGVANTDFSVAVKFNSKPAVGYQMEGLMLRQDAQHFVRSEIQSDGATLSLFVATISGTVQTIQSQSGAISMGSAIWIKATRTGNSFAIGYSTDGTNYTMSPAFTSILTISQVGIYGGNYNNTPASAQAFSVLVDSFNNLLNVALVPPSITTASLGSGTINAVYSQTLTADGSTPITWVMSSGVLCNGLNLSAGGMINGIPTAIQTCSFGVKATNAQGSNTKTLSLTIGTIPPVGVGVTYTTPDFVYPSDIGYYNVRTYGATGNGTTDDTAAIKAAIKAALTNTKFDFGYGGRFGTVYFPSGTYLISDQLLWATYGNGNAVITANVSGGCITGFNIVNGGSGYRKSSYNFHGEGDPGPSLYITGGGGSGASWYTHVNGGAITGVQTAEGNQGTVTCSGSRYTSAPNVVAINQHAWLRFEGQNKSNTIIKLKDHTTKFGNGNCQVSYFGDTSGEWCLSMIVTMDEAGDLSPGSGEACYDNDIWNLTLNTGIGNPGAVALAWCSSNRSSLKNLILKSDDGHSRAGLNIAMGGGFGGNGPNFAKNIIVDGFDYGIYSVNPSNSQEVFGTLETIDLHHINTAGIVNDTMNLTIRNVFSDISVPAVINRNAANLFLGDSNFTGGSSNISAVQAQSTNTSGPVFLRNIKSSGYASALSTGTGNTVVPGATVTTFSSPSIASLYGTSNILNIVNIPDTPEYRDSNFSNWESVANHGAACQPNSNQNATSCIQAALNAGKPIVYFPWGMYWWDNTLHIPTGVRAVIGANSYIENAQTGGSPNDDGGHRQNYWGIRFEGTGTNSQEWRNFVYDQQTQASTVQFSGSAPAVFAESIYGVGTNNAGTGTIYFQDAAIPNMSLSLGSNQRMWGRNIDSEGSSQVHFTINGGISWILGFKTEAATHALVNVTNGVLEVLGGWSSTALGPSSESSINATNSSISIEDWASRVGGWSNLVTDIRGTTSHTLGNNSFWGGGLGPVLSYSGVQWIPPSISSAAVLPNGKVGTAYSQTLTAMGDAVISWTKSAGTLCTGLSFSSGGVLTGIPTTAQSCSFTVQAQNSRGTDQLQITVQIQ